MRPTIGFLLLGASFTAARNVFPLSDHKDKILNNRVPAPSTNHLQSRSDQAPMTPDDLGPVVPNEPSKPSAGSGSNDNSALTISDVLPTQRQINIFAGLTRDIESLSSRLESSLPSSNTTLLAPLNSAMQALPRKPWEDRPGDDSSVKAASNEDKAASNLKRFVLEHVVPVSPWKSGKENAVKTLWSQEGNGQGREIWWETRKGGDDGQQERKVLMPGELVVEGVIGRVGNGEIWSLKGVVNYE